MSASPTVSIVVPSLIGQVEPLRRRLARQSLEGWELVVVPGVSPVARARNLGARQASAALIVFIDDDVEFGDAHVLRDVIAALERLAPGDAIGLRWRLADDATPFQRRQARTAIVADASASAAMSARCEPVAAAERVSWRTVGTACFAMRREAFHRIGGFDEQLRSGEDFELCYRLERAGGAIWRLAGRWITHQPPRTFREAVRKAIWYELGNAQVARKHPEAKYRMPIRGIVHAAGYLALRTLCLPLLCMLKVSYHRRRPAFQWRPEAALLSYVGAWAYCVGWFAAAGRVSVSVPPTVVRQISPAASAAVEAHR